MRAFVCVRGGGGGGRTSSSLTWACVARQSADKNNRVSIFPLPHMPVLKDLVPDLSEFFEQHKSVRPWLELSPENAALKTEVLQSKGDRKKLDGLYECILCACCSTSCPSYWWSQESNGQCVFGARRAHAPRA